MNTLSEPTGAQSVDRALGLLAIVRRSAERGIALSEILQESGLNKPTARRLLLALIRAGLVEQDALSRRYHLGEEAFVMGALAAGRHNLLEIAGESLRRLADRSEDTAFFSVRRQNFSVCLQREEGRFPIRTHVLQAGNHHPLGVGAASMALLADLPDEEVERICRENEAMLAAQFPRYTPEVLRVHVQETRACGYSVNKGLVLPNSWAIGITVTYSGGRLAGALSLAAIDSRMGDDRREELVALLRGEARQMSDRLERMFAPRTRAMEAAGQS
ncbi:IclR family transcriptional regulator [Thioclava sp. BHET1]|nr:IclR family transcriptional regulator [Thioclava sp. BHET1]